MQNFHSLKSNCHICSGARRDCRQNMQTNLIHCRHDVGSPLGFRFVGVDKIGFNMWATDDRQSDSFKWEQERQQRADDRERRLAAEAEHYKQLLNADERDHNIRRIHAQLGLSSRHRQHLQDRGLNDAQIDAGKFFSTAPWQEVTGINSQLAGVDLYGRKLLIGQAGFACPVPDVQGRLVSWQTRFDDATDNKYKWPTSQSSKRPNGATAHLQNGEMPLGCYRPVDGVKLDSIGLAEGFLKSFIAAQQLRQVLIGAAGGNFTAGKKQLKTYLDALAAELDTKTVDLYPDAGAVANTNVMPQYERVLRLLDSWGYSVRVAWWGQWTKEQPDIDELTDFEQISYISPEEFLHLAVKEQAAARSFSDLVGWLPKKMQRWLKKRSPWGFGKVEPTEPAAPSLPALEYEQGDRQRFWQESLKQGHRHILDNSTTGTGKSFDAGKLKPEDFGARQIIYVSNDHRNPSTDTLKDWQDLEARHKGLYRDKFGKTRRVTDNQEPSVAANCGRNETIAALRSKNISGADTAELVCATCPQFELCRGGVRFGFLKQRAIALKSSQLRAHPDSLPIADSYDYSDVVLLWDEAGTAIKAHRSIEIKASDVTDAMSNLMIKLPNVFDVLRPLLVIFLQFLKGEIKQPNKFGWGDSQVRQALPDLGDIDIDAIRAALTPEPVGILNTTQEYDVDVSDLPRNLRKKFSRTDRTTAERIINELALDWLPDFLDVVMGRVNGSLRINYGTLTLTLGDERLAKIAKAARGNIYLDATATAEDIARPLQLSEPILTAKQAVPESDNIEIVQVTSLGRLGLSERSEYCQKRVDAVTNQIKQDATGQVAVIDFKCQSKEGDGKRHWWVDSRGINDLETCQTLILIGTPCPNLAALEAEFTILYGRSPQEGREWVRYPVQIKGQPEGDSQDYLEMNVSADLEFRDFVRRRILAEFRQAPGRLRAHRRLGELLKVYIVADYPLDIPVKLIKASDITLEAASKTERTLAAMISATEQLVADGLKTTQSAIAKLAGCSQQLVSRHWNLLQTLLVDIYSKSSKNCEPPPDPEDADWISQEYLPLLAEESPDDVLKGMLTTLEAYGQVVFSAIWAATPATAQIKIMKNLLLPLPLGELRALQLALEVRF